MRFGKMVMKERLATAIKGIRSDKKISTLDEKSTRAEVIDPVLERLGWDKFGEDFVIEYSVPGGAVDYALHVRNMPKVFIEAKNPREDLRRHVDQLVTYCAKHGVPLAALTNGLNWWFYLPLKEGTVEARQFCRLDISVQDISEICNRLIEFLARENVYSGVAVENAEAHLQRLHEARNVDKALPQAWQDLIAGPDDMLVELINEKVEYLCGVKAGANHIKEFLVGLSRPARTVKQSPKFEKKEPAYVGRTERISPHLSDLALSKLDNIEEKELLHARLSNIVEHYVDPKYVRDHGIRAAVRQHMTNRGFIEFEILAEWGGIKSDHTRFCKIDICNAKHAENRRK